MSQRSFVKPVALAGALALAASAAADAQPSAPAPGPCTIDDATGKLAPELRRTVVITDPAVVKEDVFSLSRTLAAILSTAVQVEEGDPNEEAKRTAASSRSEQVALLTSLIRSFRMLDRLNPDSNVPMPAAFRPGEAELDPIELLNKDNPERMRPIGLFNRLDLAPASLRYCGEHRIVYAKGPEITPPDLDRFLLIFEAAVDNPDPQNRPEGCLRIARFWDSLQGKTGEELTSALENFYYQGDLGDGQPNIQPVVHHQHYGIPFGQVRGNLFVTKGDPTQNPWMLREWRISLSADGNPVFVPDTVKDTPDPALYAGERSDNESQDFADLRPEFQENFVIDHVRELIELELQAQQNGGDVPDSELFARLSARFEDRFNTFESISQEDRTGTRPSQDPVIRAEGTELIGRIDQDLANFRLPPDRNLTAQHILARAGALSCAGCHQISVDQEIAPGVTWPKTAGRFVHITEGGTLSEALEKHFLPARCRNMQERLQAGAAPALVAEAPAMLPTKARAAFARIQSLQARAAKIEALPDLEVEVQAARRQDFRSPGAFIPFRRSH